MLRIEIGAAFRAVSACDVALNVALNMALYMALYMPREREAAVIAVRL